MYYERNGGIEKSAAVIGNAGIEQGTGMEKRESRPSPETVIHAVHLSRFMSQENKML